MDISRQFLALATETAERMLSDGNSVEPIDASGFYLLSIDQEFGDYTPICEIAVKGKKFVIVW